MPGPTKHPLFNGAAAAVDEEQLAAFWEHEEPSRHALRLAEDALRGCTSTTQLLRALADVLENKGDPTSAELLSSITRDFAEHEAFNH